MQLLFGPLLAGRDQALQLRAVLSSTCLFSFPFFALVLSSISVSNSILLVSVDSSVCSRVFIMNQQLGFFSYTQFLS